MALFRFLLMLSAFIYIPEDQTTRQVILLFKLSEKKSKVAMIWTGWWSLERRIPQREQYNVSIWPCYTGHLYKIDIKTTWGFMASSKFQAVPNTPSTNLLFRAQLGFEFIFFLWQHLSLWITNQYINILRLFVATSSRICETIKEKCMKDSDLLVIGIHKHSTERENSLLDVGKLEL
jgi:hypothetical protein